MPVPKGKLRDTSNGKYLVIAVGNGRSVAVLLKDAVQIECADNKCNGIPIENIEVPQCPCTWKTCASVCLDDAQLIKLHSERKP